MISMLAIVAFELGEKIDAAQIENCREIQLGVPSAINLRNFVQQSNLPLGVIQLLRRREVGLVEQDQIGERDLLASLC